MFIQILSFLRVFCGHKCPSHLSVWYYSKGIRQYRSFTGAHMHALCKQLTAAGAASGKPGDHGRMLKWLTRHRHSNLRQVTASGHEPRSQAEGKRTHQKLRSPEAISRRLDNYRHQRQVNRREYRKWNAQVQEAGFFTLASLHGPSERVQLSTHQIRRAYPRHTHKPTLASQAEIFKRYIKKSLLDLPPSRNLTLRFPLPTFTFHTWNIETLIGISKYEMMSTCLQKYSVKLLCMQETKSTTSNEITSGPFRYLLSGTPEEPHAGVGFAIHASLLPFVHDFFPFSGRIAVLILNTKPRKIALFSIYAPSQLADAAADNERKQQFLLVGMSDFIGPVIFAPNRAEDDEDLERTNLSHLFDFLVATDSCLASSYRPRPLHKLVTYREINSPPDASPYSPSTDHFAVLDHVVAPRSFRKYLRDICTMPTATLPWFHRHYLLKANVALPTFECKPSIAKTPSLLCDTRHLKQTLSVEIQNQISLALPSAARSPVLGHTTPSVALYTDGSCPKNCASYQNPAGWGWVLLTEDPVDGYGPVGTGLPFSIPGSNNTAEFKPHSKRLISFLASLHPSQLHFSWILNMSWTFLLVSAFLNHTSTSLISFFEPLLSLSISFLWPFRKCRRTLVLKATNGLTQMQPKELMLWLPLADIPLPLH